MIIKPAEFNGIVTIEGTPALDIKRISHTNGLSNGYIIGEGENAIYISSTSGSVNNILTALKVFANAISSATNAGQIAMAGNILNTALSNIIVEG